MVVVASVDLAGVGARGRQLDRRRAAKFSAQMIKVDSNKPRCFKSL